MFSLVEFHLAVCHWRALAEVRYWWVVHPVEVQLAIACWWVVRLWSTIGRLGGSGPSRAGPNGPILSFYIRALADTFGPVLKPAISL